MNPRERYIAALRFEETDKIPLMPGNGRESTYKRWRSESLPNGEDATGFIMKELGIPRETAGKSGFFLDTKMNPVFEEKLYPMKTATI